MNDATPPPISTRRAALTVVTGSALVGVAIGALWSFLAPTIHGVVALTRGGDRLKAYLGNDADQFFLSAFLLLGMLCAAAVIAAVLVWQWRAHRGPTMVAALAVGAAVAAGVAAAVGAAIAHFRYGTIDVAGAPVTPEHRVHYVIEAPPVFFAQSPLQAATTLLFPAAVACLVYGLMAVATPRDDLGAWPPVEEPVRGRPVTTESALPSAQ